MVNQLIILQQGNILVLKYFFSKLTTLQTSFISTYWDFLLALKTLQPLNSTIVHLFIFHLAIFFGLA